MMHIVLDEPSFAAYRSAIETLIRDGARRLLFYGWGPIGQALHGSIACAGSSGGSSVVFACMASGAGAPVAMLSREQALATSWDAVIVLPTEGSREAVGEAMSHASRGIVYPGRRPPFVGVVAVHKGGTNLIAEMMRAFGYKVMGMGVISDLPAPGPELSWEDRERQYISSAPPYSCYFTHSLPAHNGDNVGHRPLFTQWCREPFPLVFIYRDPRAVLCSFVRYVLKRGKSQEFTSTP